MSTDDKIAAYRDDYMTRAAVTFANWIGRACESPIEQLLLACMLAKGWGPGEHVVSSWYELHRQAADAGLTPGAWVLGAERCACFCVLQLPVTFGPSKYRVDFAFIEHAPEGKPRMYAVELDGHDFHERTKEQASKDKRRDRAFAANGWTVLRFSGSDVYRDPEAVLAEVVKVVNGHCWPWMVEDES